MAHVETSNAHQTKSINEQPSGGIQNRVSVATFESLRGLIDVGVLKIQKCTTFDDSMDGLSIVVEVDGSLKKAMKQIFDLEDFNFDVDERTWLVQITSTTEPSSMIFFKEAEFSYIYITNGKITNQGQRCEENHFDELVKEILPNILTNSKLSLLDLSLTLDQLTSFSEKSNLCRKFLKIFVGFVSQLANDRNYNALMIAIAEKDESLVDTLKESEFDLALIGSNGKRAVDLAIDNEMFELFVELIEADSPFPEAAQIEKVSMQSNAFRKLCAVITERGEFHDIIGAGDTVGLKEKISQNSKLKFAYGLDNKSALTYALEHKQFEIFAFLQFKGFLRGVDPFYEEAFVELTEVEKNSIALYNMEHYRTFTTAHVNSLVSKTKIASKAPDESKSYEEVWKFLNDLDAIPQVSEVLQIVALFEDLTINFDFESSNVHKMHPSQSPDTDGVFFEGGFIYIAAGQWQSDRKEVLGVISHEFTHCAMKIFYKNSCKPYKVDDFERRKEFEQIVHATQTVVEFEENPEKWISLVYDKYPRKAWSAELIVRVPHLLAIYKDDDDKIEELKLTFVELFKFYETKTRPDLQRHLKIAVFAEKVKTLNDEAGLIRQIKNEEIEFETNQAAACFEEIGESKINVVVSNSSIHSMAAMIEHLDQHEIFHSVIDLRFLVKQLSSIQELLEANQQLSIIIYCADQVGECQKEFIEIFRGFENCKIFLIVDDSGKQILMKLLDASKLNVCELNHKWQDLNSNYRTRIMQKVIKFQGNLISLGDLLGRANSCSALDVLPLNQIVGQRQLTVSEKAVKASKFYFPRRFFVESERNEDSETELRFDDVVARVERKSFAIISGIAGLGKSTVLKEIAKKLKEKLPNHWVSFVDLKQHFDVFRCELSTFYEFAFSLIGSIQSGNENFERELFKHFYGNGKVLLLLDGFDEISPHYNEIVSDFLSKFEPKQGNQLWITTRSHLQSHLEQLFGVASFQLSPFDDDEQIDFLLGHWQKDSPTTNLDPTLDSHARSVVGSLNTFLSRYSDSIGIPLLLGIAASTYKQKVGAENAPEIIKIFNLYSLYGEFIDQMFKIWRHDKGSLSVGDQTKIDKSENAVLDVHRKLAMKLLFPYKRVEAFGFSVEYDKNVWTAPILARVGLVLCSDDLTDVPTFLNRTFAEFLVAQFIVLNLKSENQTQALKVFLEALAQREVVCQFLNFALSEDEITNLTINITDHDYLKEVFGRSFGIETLRKIMKSINREQIFRLYLKILKQILTADEIRSMLNETDATGNIIHSVSLCGNEIMMKEVFSVCREYLSNEEIKRLLIWKRHGCTNCLHLTATCNNFEPLKVWLEFVKSFFTVEELKKMWRMRDRWSQNVFLQSVRERTHESLKNVLEISTRLTLTVEEIKSMLKEKDIYGRNLFFVDLRIDRSLANYSKHLKTFLNDEEIIDLMLSADNEGNNFLYYAFYWIRHPPEVIQNFFADLKGLLSDEQQKRLFRMRNKKNQNCFAASFSHGESFVKFSKYVLRNYQESLVEFRKYALLNFKEYLEIFIQNAECILPDDEVKAMLEKCNRDNLENFDEYLELGGKNVKAANIFPREIHLNKNEFEISSTV